MGHLLLRVFLAYCIATVLLLMTLAADHLEAGGEAAGSRALAEFTRKSQIPAWLSSADGKPVRGQGPPESKKIW